MTTDETTGDAHSTRDVRNLVNACMGPENRHWLAEWFKAAEKVPTIAARLQGKDAEGVSAEKQAIITEIVQAHIPQMNTVYSAREMQTVLAQQLDAWTGAGHPTRKPNKDLSRGQIHWIRHPDGTSTPQR